MFCSIKWIFLKEQIQSASPVGTRLERASPQTQPEQKQLDGPSGDQHTSLHV